ncbi:MAG TPA: hypothetical protein VF437_08520, partial [Verrucomicrobiae bacterium]
MKLKFFLGWSSALCLSAMIAQAQETNQPADFDQRLKQMQESFEKRQQEMQERFDQKIAAQDVVIESLKQQLASKPANAPAPSVMSAVQPSPETPSASSPSWSPSQPLTIARAGSAYMNISFDAVMMAVDPPAI